MSGTPTANAANAAKQKAEEEKARSKLLGVANPLRSSGGSGNTSTTPNTNSGTPRTGSIPQPPQLNNALKRLTDPTISASSISSSLKRELMAAVTGSKPGTPPPPPQPVPAPPPPPGPRPPRTKAQQQTFEAFLAVST